MSQAKPSAELPRLVQRWQAFDARHPLVADFVLTAFIFVINNMYYITDEDYRPAAAIVAVSSTVGVLLRRVYTWAAFLMVSFVPPVARMIDSGLLRDPNWSVEGAAAGMQAVNYSDLIPAAILVYTLVVRKAPRLAWPAVIVGYVVVVASALIWVHPAQIPMSVMVDTVGYGFSSLLAVSVRTSRLHTADLQRRAEQLAFERDQREQLAASQERARIAREMHDVVAHSLSVMISLSDGALSALERNPGLARRAIEEAAATGRSALADTRRLLGVLREDAVGSSQPGDVESEAEYAPQPTEATIASLVEQFCSTGLPVTLTETGPPLPDDAGLRLAVYRIVQEALTNVLRYASTSTAVDVRVDKSHQDVTIVVENDAAPGSTISVGTGKGLIGMRERVAVYDGTIEAGPTATGWKVRATMSWTKG